MMRALTFLMPQTNDVFVDIAASSPKQAEKKRPSGRAGNYKHIPYKIIKNGKSNFIKKEAKSPKPSPQLMSKAKVA